MKEIIKQLKKEIEKKFLKIRGWKDWEEYDKIIESSQLDKNVREELISVCIDQTLQEVCEEIEEMDIELFLEDIIDKKTGKKVEVPKEIWDLWNIYWEHIQEKLLKKFQGEEE